MTRRTITIFLINGLFLLLLATPLFAGGWAVVTVDHLPQYLHVGEVTTLGFTVRQHGRNGVNLEGVLVRATDPISGETLTQFNPLCEHGRVSAPFAQRSLIAQTQYGNAEPGVKTL